jgi:transposase InsO family protein
MRATKPLEIVHSDVCGPMRTTSSGGARYFVTYIDDFSRKVWVYLLKSKGECLEKFKEFKALVETQSEHKIKVFRSDNGGEYISKGYACTMAYAMHPNTRMCEIQGVMDIHV